MDPQRHPDSVSSVSFTEELTALEAAINAFLPPRYVGCYEEVPPSSMGSASLKYDREGRVAWGEIWTTFCHLALAGGPPHRGRWLPGVTTREAEARPAEQQSVVAEIKRAIRLSSSLRAIEDAPAGWVGIRCEDQDMAAWMVRAIVAENVCARHEGSILYVPAGPDFRLEKEVKNVVVCVAKSCHYLLDHVEPEERPRGLNLHVLQPPAPDDLASNAGAYQAAAEKMAQDFQILAGLAVSPAAAAGWLGFECASEEMAVWMQRAVIAKDVLARRENATLFIPVCLVPAASTDGDRLINIVADAHRLWQFKTANS